MQKLVNPFCIITLWLCFLFIVTPLNATNSEKKLSYNKTTKDPKTTPTNNEEIVEKSYIAFIENWMAKLDKVSQHNMNNINFLKNGDYYVGQFITYGPEKEFWIKKTNEKPTTHVGYLKYKQKVHEKKGTSLLEAKNCQAYVIQESNVTEIFRYTNGKWIY